MQTKSKWIITTFLSNQNILFIAVVCWLTEKCVSLGHPALLCSPILNFWAIKVLMMELNTNSCLPISTPSQISFGSTRVLSLHLRGEDIPSTTHPFLQCSSSSSPTASTYLLTMHLNCVVTSCLVSLTSRSLPIHQTTHSTNIHWALVCVRACARHWEIQQKTREKDLTPTELIF